MVKVVLTKSSVLELLAGVSEKSRLPTSSANRLFWTNWPKELVVTLKQLALAVPNEPIRGELRHRARGPLGRLVSSTRLFGHDGEFGER